MHFRKAKSSLVERLHKKGHLAVHCYPDFCTLYDRLDELPIIGNLREDGGSELKREKILRPISKIFYPIISATVLPPAHYSYEQDLYNQMSDFFFIINVKNTVIKDFAMWDLYAIHEGLSGLKRNKHSRPTYKALYPSMFQHLSDNRLENKKNGSSYKATYTSLIQRLSDDHSEMTDQDRLDLMDFIQRDYIRMIHGGKGTRKISLPLNEALLKIDISSVIGIGTTTSRILANPEILLQLFLLQQEIFTDIGILYPLHLYNNTPQSETIEYLGVTMHSNKVFVMNDLTTLLNKMIIYFSHGLATDSRESRLIRKDSLAPFTKNDVVDIERVKLFLSSQVPTRTFDCAHKMLQEVKQANDDLSKLLSSYSEDDHVIRVHKQSKKDFKRYHYPEINQGLLESFIKKKVLQDDKISSEDARVTHYKKAYNLQFRLQIYEKLLSKKIVVNLYNVSRDLAWFSVLQKRIPERAVTQAYSFPDERPRLLFEYKADINNKYHGLVEAVENGQIEIVTKLLKHKADINYQRPRDGRTALTEAIRYGYQTGDRRIEKLILANKPNVNIQDHDGYSALLLYASREEGESVRTVLALKADINHQDKYGHTALFWANYWRRDDIVHLLSQVKNENECKESKILGRK